MVTFSHVCLHHIQQRQYDNRNDPFFPLAGIFYIVSAMSYTVFVSGSKEAKSLSCSVVS